jgi:hypothetical protein
VLAEENPPADVGGDRAAERDTRRQLRPAADGLLDLRERRSHPCAHAVLVHDREEEGDLVLGLEPAQLVGAHRADQSVEDRAVRLEIESLHVEQATIARVHDHGDPVSARTLPDHHLHVEIVTFLDQEVELAAAPGEELVDGVGLDPLGEAVDLQVRIDLEHLPRGEQRLLHPDLVDPPAETVEVREAEAIVVSDLVRAADPLEREGDRRHVPHREPDHADARTGEPELLVAGELVAVAVGAHLAQLVARKDVNEAGRPGVPDPRPIGLGLAIAEVSTHASIELFPRPRAGRIAQRHQLPQLFFDRVVRPADVSVRDQLFAAAARFLATEIEQDGLPRVVDLDNHLDGTWPSVTGVSGPPEPRSEPPRWASPRPAPSWTALARTASARASGARRAR